MMHMNFPHLLKLGLLLFVLWTFSACSTGIGDECESTAECPTGAICDVTVPGGYCLVRGCERNDCPEDSVCVRFDNDSSQCMRYCEANEDCRDGHVCRDDIPPARFCYLDFVPPQTPEPTDMGGDDTTDGGTDAAMPDATMGTDMDPDLDHGHGHGP